MNRIYSVTKAYHSTRQKGLKKFESRTTTATIDTGEGAHVHGWGLYLQADEKANREDYLRMFTGGSGRESDYAVTAWGQNITAYHTDDSCDIDGYNSFEVYEFEPLLPSEKDLMINLRVNGFTDKEITYFLNNVIRDFGELDPDNDDIPEILLHYKIDDLENTVRLAQEGISDYSETLIDYGDPEPLEDGTHYAEASQYTVEIPDDMVFIDEDMPVPEKIFRIFEEEFIKPNVKKFTPSKGTISGSSFYMALSVDLGQEGASIWLSEHGVDGMTYEGGRDHGCFVIYNCDKLKIVAEY